MNPIIISTKEATRLGPGSIPVQVLIVTWSAGTFGPFTEQSSWADLGSGKLMADLQAKARKLDSLPLAGPSA